jgi:hypothetical protein
MSRAPRSALRPGRVCNATRPAATSINVGNPGLGHIEACQRRTERECVRRGTAQHEESRFRNSRLRPACRSADCGAAFTTRRRPVRSTRTRKTGSSSFVHPGQSPDPVGAEVVRRCRDHPATRRDAANRGSCDVEDRSSPRRRPAVVRSVPDRPRTCRPVADRRALAFDARKRTPSIHHVLCRRAGIGEPGALASQLRDQASRKCRRRREWTSGVDYEHDQCVQIDRPATRNLHGLVGAMSGFRMTGLDSHRSVRTANALFALEHEECFRSGMAVDRSDATGGTAGVIDSKKKLRCRHARDGTNFGHLVRAAGGPARWAQGEQPDFARRLSNKGPVSR